NNLVLGPASDAGTTSGTTGGTVQAGESRGPDPTASDTSGDAAAEASTASDVPDTTGSDTLEVSTETSSTGLEDASSEAGSTGDTDASGIAYYEPSDDAPDGNDTRELAIPLLGAASIYLPRGDRDWFSVQVPDDGRSEEHTSELQSRENLVCRLLLEKKK